VLCLWCGLRLFDYFSVAASLALPRRENRFGVACALIDSLVGGDDFTIAVRADAPPDGLALYINVKLVLGHLPGLFYLLNLNSRKAQA